MFSVDFYEIFLSIQYSFLFQFVKKKGYIKMLLFLKDSIYKDFLLSIFSKMLIF